MSAKDETASSGTPTHKSNDLPSVQPVVVGLYGIEGCGKTYILEKLKQDPKLNDAFIFFEGSEAIVIVTDGGLAGFQKLPRDEQKAKREAAINYIQQQSIEKEKPALVTGHFMFWPQEKRLGQEVYTQRDIDVYTHIIYLDLQPAVVQKFRERDSNRERAQTSVDHLIKWQKEEKQNLGRICIKTAFCSPSYLLSEP